MIWTQTWDGHGFITPPPPQISGIVNPYYGELSLMNSYNIIQTHAISFHGTYHVIKC